MKRLPARYRKILPGLLVALTAGLFAYLFVKHPEYRHTLAHTNFWVLVLIAGLYAVMLACVNWTNDITLRMCGTRLPARDNALLTGYTSIVNFFGPLQSGPAMRGAYLKQKLHLSLRSYTLGSLIYYACYAIISALFLLAGSGHRWPIALVLFVGVCIGCAGVLALGQKRFGRAAREAGFHATLPLWIEMFVATLCQLFVWAVIYYVELRAVHTGASLLQAITYGGAANFALFVSLTPGAIGFREAFLAFSKQLHHISTSGILAASVIDRSVFVAFLGLLALAILGTHANQRFKKVSAQRS